MKTTIIALSLLAALMAPTVAAACTGFMCDYHPYRYDNYGNRYVHYDDYYHRDRYYDRFDAWEDEVYYNKRSSKDFYYDNDFYYDKKPMKRGSTYYRWYW